MDELKDFGQAVLVTLGIGLGVGVAIFLGCALFSDHKIQGYYLSHDGIGICINKDVAWALDTRVYCSSDAGTVVSLYGILRQEFVKVPTAVAPTLPQ